MLLKRDSQKWVVVNKYTDSVICKMIESMTLSCRRVPNILVSGTPCCGKTTLCESIMNIVDNFKGVENMNFTHYPISELAKSNEWCIEYDEMMDSWILDEKKMLKALKSNIHNGGCIVDFHGCNLFPKKWFDLVVILTTNNTILYDRYLGREYKSQKITENIECEIMQVILEEARCHFGEERCIVLQSNDTRDIKSNSTTISSLILESIKNNKL